jgi:hypothetical protein
MKRIFIFLILICASRVLPAQPVEPPLPPSPIATFREWLRQSPEERKVALAKRSDQSRKVIEQKLRDYSAMTPEERDRRLNATELQWYVTRLLKMQKAQRDLAVRQVPVIWQPMVMERLAAWDRMPTSLQREALEHEMVIEYLSAPADQQAVVLKTLSESERNALAARIDRWRILPATERARLDERVDEFFKMQPEKQQQALNNFSAAERESMEQTLKAFRQLTPSQRELCVRSFAQFAEKFAAMDRTNQIAFLKNAERWQEMSQKERDIWRSVVAVVPPMPPLPAPTPPLPR